MQLVQKNYQKILKKFIILYMIILIGPSASGKTEVCKLLCSKFNYKKFITTTTRQIRNKEINGLDYYFISLDEFKNKINNNEFIETVFYNNNYYGTEKKEISLNSVLIVEPNGLKHFNNLKNHSIVSFFLESSKELRKERMLQRGDNIIDINLRLENDDNIFNDEIKKESNFILDSDLYSITELTDIINNLYQEKIKKII